MFLRFPEGKFKAVTLSYDDGDKSDIRIAKVLNAHKMKGTFNINSAWMTRETKLSPE
jgi:peptidoglycan/xylan/chitin deacetylase (PgdA/CDA1 family)